MQGLILAAGDGSRMGQPKACLPWGKGTLLEAQLRAALSAGCTSVVAVVRAPVARQISAGLAEVSEHVRLVISSAEPSLGPAGSIAAFVGQSSPFGADELMAVSPVDILPQAWGVLPGLVQALQTNGTIMGARPVHRGHGGHPVLVRASILAVYGRAEPPEPLRDVLRALGNAVRDVEVAEAAVVTDLDTPDDFARWAPAG